MLCDLLRADGCDVSVAHDGLQAVVVLSECQDEGTMPNLILLDMHMDGLSGWDFQSIVHEHGFFIPTVIVTGDPNPERCARDVGAVAYLPKPFDISALEELLDQMVVVGTDAPRNPRDLLAS
jgi:CheY-like chemotaxis protein